MSLPQTATVAVPERAEQMVEFIWKDCVNQIDRGAFQLILSAEAKHQLGRDGLFAIAIRYA